MGDNLVAHIVGESSVRMFENRVLNRIFGPKKDEVTGEWRELYNDMLNEL